MKKLIFLSIFLGIFCSCSKVCIYEQNFCSMEKRGNVVCLTSPTSTLEVLLENPVYTDESPVSSDTLWIEAVQKTFPDDVKTRLKSVGDIYTRGVNRNFAVVGKAFDMAVYLPYRSRNGEIQRMETSFSFTREVPVLNNCYIYYPSVHVRAEFCELKQDLSGREPYSELVYAFDVIVEEEGVEVGSFSFKRSFWVENNPITFNATIEGWDCDETDMPA